MQVCGIQKKVAMVYLQLIGLVLGLGVYEVLERVPMALRSFLFEYYSIH